MGDNLEEGRRTDTRVVELVFGHDVTHRADLSRQLAASLRITRQTLRCGGAGPDQERESQEVQWPHLYLSDSDETEDEVPEPPEDPVSRPGDLWVLGNHRLLCGDATVLTDVERVLGGQLADMTFCDPPYGVNYANTPKDKLRGKHRPILNDNLGAGFEAFLYDACANILAVTKGAVYVWHVIVGAAHAAEGLRGRRRPVGVVRYVAIVLVVLLFLSQVAKLAASGG